MPPSYVAVKNTRSGRISSLSLSHGSAYAHSSFTPATLAGGLKPECEAKIAPNIGQFTALQNPRRGGCTVQQLHHARRALKLEIAGQGHRCADRKPSRLEASRSIECIQARRQSFGRRAARSGALCYAAPSEIATTALILCLVYCTKPKPWKRIKESKLN